jgi:1-acyl-sn-glycerol-3-phosphate acyltransferase
MKKFSRFFLGKNGWKIVHDIQIPDKCVICMAPHTSNWDFLWGLLFGYALELHAHFLMKREWFYFPMGLLMKSLGGIPVDRKRKTSLTDTMIFLFKQSSIFRLAIAPEGTRQFTKEWKKGFYFIANKAEVPIVITFIDYKTKSIGFASVFYPTGDYAKDIPQIQAFYKGIEGKFSDQFYSSPSN